MPTLEESRSNLLSSEEATHFLPYSQTHILDLARKGQLPCIKIGRKVFFKKNELAAILDRGLPKMQPIIAQEQK
jgi:excisionase family DNA binding protein